MKTKSDAWTIVIVGLWNTYIFSPDWVSKTLLNQNDVALEFLIISGKPQVRFSTNRLIFAAAEDKIVIAAKDTTDETLKEMERVAKHVVEELPHTPISGIGVNMGYVVDDLQNDLGRLFPMGDVGGLSDAGCEIEQTEVKRALTINGGQLNLRIVYGDITPEIHFNFHREIAATSTVAEKTIALTDKVLEYRDVTLSVLKQAYKLELDAGE